jgi:L-serine dehydratase
MQFSFKSVANASALHPNSLKLNLKGQGRSVEVIGQSRGGGVIRIVEVDGFTADFSANMHTLMVEADDIKGSIAFIADVIAHDDCNIAAMTVSRKGKNQVARQFIEMDSGLKPITLAYIQQLSWIKNITYIPNID